MKKFIIALVAFCFLGTAGIAEDADVIPTAPDAAANAPEPAPIENEVKPAQEAKTNRAPARKKHKRKKHRRHRRHR